MASIKIQGQTGPQIAKTIAEEILPPIYKELKSYIDKNREQFFRTSIRECFNKDNIFISDITEIYGQEFNKFSDDLFQIVVEPLKKVYQQIWVYTGMGGRTYSKEKFEIFGYLVSPTGDYSYIKEGHCSLSSIESFKDLITFFIHRENKQWRITINLKIKTRRWGFYIREDGNIDYKHLKANR